MTPPHSSHPPTLFLLHVSWPDGGRALVVGPRFELSSAPGVEAWAPSDSLDAPVQIEIRGDEHPTLWIGGRNVGPRIELEPCLTIAVAPLPLDAHQGPPIATLIGTSLPMRRLFRHIDDARSSDLPLLIRGETGTGKELIARTVHDGSARASAPYVVIDCAAITESLLESELFGHVKGAFSGATSNRTGAFEAANGGTVFIDEVGELPPSMQPKLLRVLESGTFRRVGENIHRAANVRVIAATHRDLRQMVAQGTFREDLYYRLAVLEASVPPLRERHGDLPALVRSFVPFRTFDALTEAQWEAIETHQWRGNVRELRNFAQRATLRGWEGLFDSADPSPEEPPSTRNLPSFQELRSQPRLPPSGPATRRRDDEPPSDSRIAARPSQDSRSAFRSSPDAGEHPAPPAPNDVREYREGESLADFRTRWALSGEATYLAAVLRAAQGSVVRAAALAGVDRTHFHRLLRRHGMAKASARDALVETGEVAAASERPEPGEE